MLKSQKERIISKILERDRSIFISELQKNKDQLLDKLKDASILVIGGAGTIGSHYVLELLRYPVQKICIVDRDENSLTKLSRQIKAKNRYDTKLDFVSLDFGSPIFKKFYEENKAFDYIANFAALKHVRTESDLNSTLSILENNVQNQIRLLELLMNKPPKNYFSVSTDKANKPVSIMGASKKLMENILSSYQDKVHISSARFPNVLFSNGSLLEGYEHLYNQQKPLPCPLNIKRYFISGYEAAHICIAAQFLSQSGELLVPKFEQHRHLLSFEHTVKIFLEVLGFKAKYFRDLDEAMNYHIEDEFYPVYLSNTNTSGEKEEESFYSDEEELINNKFNMLGIVKMQKNNLDTENLSLDIHRIMKEASSKDELVNFLKVHVKDFEHSEKGKSLYSKY
ncbi:polysaccharide biosynthesis protein [Hyphobacterium sp. CCMP332]|nr:polysaccharide biosynthesis protein [Hyphobacterium sp. CCMP332]